MDYYKLKDDLVKWLRETVYGAGAKGIVYGLSGGADSAAIAGLAKEAFGKDSLGIIMPINSDPEDEKDGLLVANKLGVNAIKVDLSSTFNEMVSNIEPIKNSMAIANIKPRLRMTTLYYYGQNKGYLVVGTSNLSEFTVGYFTKYGDSGSDIMPLADLTKTEVWELCKVLGVPEKIINKKPSAGLWKNQTDEDEMGISYNQLDKYILSNTGDEEIVKKINKMKSASEHKRRFANIFKVTRTGVK